MYTALLWFFSKKLSEIGYNIKIITKMLLTFIISAILLIMFSRWIDSVLYSLMCRLICVLAGVLIIKHQVYDEFAQNYLRLALRKALNVSGIKGR